MKYDSPVALATIRNIVSLLAEMADEAEADGDMDGYWNFIAASSRICRLTGYQQVPEALRERVEALSDASPPRL